MANYSEIYKRIKNGAVEANTKSSETTDANLINRVVSSAITASDKATTSKSASIEESAQRIADVVEGLGKDIENRYAKPREYYDDIDKWEKHVSDTRASIDSDIKALNDYIGSEFTRYDEISKYGKVLTSLGQVDYKARSNIEAERGQNGKYGTKADYDKYKSNENTLRMLTLGIDPTTAGPLSEAQMSTPINYSEAEKNLEKMRQKSNFMLGMSPDPVTGAYTVPNADPDEASKYMQAYDETRAIYNTFRHDYTEKEFDDYYNKLKANDINYDRLVAKGKSFTEANELQNQMNKNEGRSDFRKTYLLPDEMSTVTDDELDAYSYLLGYESENGLRDDLTAADYLEYLRGKDGTRRAEIIADRLDGVKTAEIIAQAYAGIDQFTSGNSGVSKLLKGNDSYTEPTVAAKTSNLVSQNLADDGVLWKVAGDLTKTVTNMLPTIVVSALVSNGLGAAGVAAETAAEVGSIVGTGLMGYSAAGNEYTERINSGEARKEAALISGLSGAWESISEHYLGSIEGLAQNALLKKIKEVGNAKLEKMFTEGLSATAQAVTRFVANRGIDMLNEGFEEVVQDIGSTVLNKIITGEWNEMTLKDEAYAFVLGALSAGVLNGGQDLVKAPKAINSLVQTRTAAKNADVSGLSDVAEILGENTKTAQKAAALTDESSANEVASVISDLKASLTEDLKKNDPKTYYEIADKLVDMGARNADIEQIAMWFNEVSNGEELSEAKLNEIAKNKNSLKAIESIIRETPITTRAMNAIENGEDLGRDLNGYEEQYKNLQKAFPELVAKAKESKKSQTILSQKDVNVAEDKEVVNAWATEKKFTEAEQKVIDTAYDGVADIMNAEGFMDAASDLIIAGQTNAGLDSISPNSLANTLSTTAQKALYDLGSKSNIATIEKQTKAVKGLKISSKEAGVVTTDGSVKLKDIKDSNNRVIKDAYDVLSKISKALGVKVVLYQSTFDESGKAVNKYNNANGVYDSSEPNTIYLDVNAGVNTFKDSTDLAKYTILEAFNHELVHFTEFWDRADYENLRTLVFGYMKKNGIDLNEEIKKVQYAQNVSPEVASNEVMADSLANILPQSEFINELVAKDKNLAEKIADIIKNFVEKLKSIFNTTMYAPKRALQEEVNGEIKYYDDIVKKFDEVLKGAIENRNAALVEGEKATTENPDVRYRLREYDAHQLENWSNSKKIVVAFTNDDIAKFVNEAINNVMYNKKLYLGMVDSSLAKVIRSQTGLETEKYNVSLGAMEIRKIFKDHGDESKESLRGQRAVTLDDVKLIKQIIEAPDKITKSAENHDGRPVILFEKLISNNERVTIVATVSQKHLDLSIQTSYINTKKSLATLLDEQASNNTSETGSGTALMKDITTFPDSRQVQLSARDTEYLELAKDPEKNEAKLRKMVDAEARKNGYNVKTFHGTEAIEDFTIFKTPAYFATRKDIANTYAKGKIFETYINTSGYLIVNGNESNNRSIDIPKELSAILRSNNNKASTNEIVEAAQETGYNGVLFKNIYDIGNRNWEWAVGEDGFNVAMLPKGTTDVIVPFNASAIKSADPVTYDDNGTVIPLSERFNSGNEDIRYSSRDSEGNTLSKTQQDYFRDSKVRDENGNLRVVYHGTDADFTVFDKTKGRSTADIQGMFFSPWELDSRGYGSKVSAYYLNITNPAPESVAYKALNLYKGQNDAGIKARKYLEKLGYDGVNNGDEEYIAFNPEQIKKIDNTSPTTNPDVRYSKRNVDFYSEEEYNAFGWINHNNIVSFGAEQRAFSNFADFKKNNFKFAETDNNEVAIPTIDKDTTVLFLIDKNSDIDLPNVTRVLKVTDNYSDISEITIEDFYDGKQQIFESTISAYVRAELFNEYKRNDYRSNQRDFAKSERSEGKTTDFYDHRQNGRRGIGDNQESQVKYSSRPNDTISNEELLSDAIRLVEEGHIRPSKDESNTLASLKDTVQTLTTKKMELALLNKEWYSLNFMPKESRTPAQQNRLNEINKVRSELQKEISAGERDILDSKDKKTLVNVLKAARSEIDRGYQRQLDWAIAEERLKSDYRIGLEKSKAKAELDKVKAEERAKRGQALLEQHMRDVDRLIDYKVKRNEKEAFTKEKAKLKANVKTLVDWMSGKGNKKTMPHVPDVLRKTTAELLTSIDFSSKSVLDGKSMTNADYKFLQSLEKLYKELNDKTLENDKEFGVIDFPQEYKDSLNNIVIGIRELIDQTIEMNDNNTFVVNQLPSSTLKDLNTVLTALKQSIKNANNFIDNAMYSNGVQASKDTIAELEQMRNSNGENGLETAIKWKLMRPTYVFDRFGKGGQAVYKGLQDGMATMGMLTKKIVEFRESLYTDEEAKEWDDKVNTYNINGTEFQAPASYLMSLYCLYNDPDARRHLTNTASGGFTIAGFKRKGGRVINDTITATSTDIENLFKENLSDRQIEVCKKMQKFMAETCASWGNYVSQARFGLNTFTNPNYFPINSDGRHFNFTVDEAPNSASVFAMLNQNWMKERNIKANNPIMVYSIFDVFANHTASMAQYRSFALPLLNTLKWLNFADENGNTVRSEMSRVFGKEAEDTGNVTKTGGGNTSYAEKFILNILKSLNGTESIASEYDSTAMKWLHRVNGAAVAYNGRVVIQQPFSIVRASLVINPKYIGKGMARATSHMKTTYGEMMKHSGIAVWKDLGFYDTNVSKGISQIIKGRKTFTDKVMDFGMKGAEYGDRATWMALWEASKAQVEAETNLKVGSEEYFKKVSDVFDNIIYRTQVVDTFLTKTEIMRNKSFVARSITSFMAEPLTSASMVVDAVEKVKIDRAKGMSLSEAIDKNKGNIARTAAVYCTSAIVMSMVTALADAWRDDDDDKFGEKYLGNFEQNLFSELSLLGKYPVAKDIVELAKSIASLFTPDIVEKIKDSDFGDTAGGKDLSRFLEDIYGFENQSLFGKISGKLTKGIEIISGKIKGTEKSYTWYAGIKDTLEVVSNMSGYPFTAATREVISLWNNTVGVRHPDRKVRTYVSADEKSEMLLNALADGDDEAVDKLLDKYYNGDTSKVSSATKKGYDNGDISESKARKILEEYGGKDSDEAYWTVEKWASDDDDYTKYKDFTTAVETGKDLKAVIKEYTDHGVEAKTLASQITKEFKPRFIAASKSERAKMKGYILNAYVALGYDREKKSKDIDKWLEN